MPVVCRGNPGGEFMLFMGFYMVLQYIIAQLTCRWERMLSVKAILFVLACLLTVAMLASGIDVAIIFLLNPRHLITIFYPMIVFKIIYDLDLIIFRKQLAYLIGYALIMTAAFSMVIGLCIMLLTGMQLPWMIVPIYGFALGSIDYSDSTASMLTFGMMKDTMVLLQVESVIGTEFCHTMLKLSLGLNAEILTTWYHVLAFLVRMLGGGIVVGLLASQLLKLIIGVFLDNIKDYLIFILLSPICVYHFADHILSVSGGTAILIYAYSLALYKTRAPLQISQDVELMNKTFARLAQSFIYFFATVPLFTRTMQYFTDLLILEYISVVLLGLIARFCILLVILPLMRVVRTKNDLILIFIMTWHAKKGVIQIVFFLHVLSDASTFELGESTVPYTFFFVALTLLMNKESAMFLTSRLTATNKVTSAGNLRDSIRKLERVKYDFISMMRMNSLLADVNWKFVDTALRITLPEGIEPAVQDFTRDKVSYCSDCHKVVHLEHTPAEIKNLTLQAKESVIKTHKMSFISQFEQGFIQQHVIAILLTFVESAYMSREVKIDPTLFQQYVHKETMFNRIQMCIKNFDAVQAHLPPRKAYRRFIYRVVMHFAYELVLLLLTILYICFKFLYLSESITYTWMFAVKTTIMLVYLFDFLFKIIAYSHILIRDGCVMYFTNAWDQCDFIILVVTIIYYFCAFIVAFVPGVTPNEQNLTTVVSLSTVYALSWLVVFKCFRIMLIVKRHEDYIAKFLSRLVGLRVMLAVNIGEALLKSYEQVLHVLPTLSEFEAIREEIRRDALVDRAIVKNELAERLRGRDWVVVTSKTSLIIRKCFFYIKQKIVELYATGTIDSYEYKNLVHAHEVSFDTFSRLNVIKRAGAEELIIELPFMSSENIGFFCYVNSQVVTYEAGEVLIEPGKYIDGIMVIMKGTLKIDFQPENVDDYEKYGALPGIDDIIYNELFKPRTYYLICGNTVGDMSYLTKRAYQCTMTAIEPTTLLLLPANILNNAERKISRGVYGMYSKMWTYFTFNLVNTILWNTKSYQSCSKDEVLKHTNRGFFPDLSMCKKFTRSSNIEDMVLVEGVIVDITSNRTYTAPRYLPRFVVYIRLVRSAENIVNPQIFVIPFNVALAEEASNDIFRTCVPIKFLSEKAGTLKVTPSTNFKYLYTDAISPITSIEDVEFYRRTVSIMPRHLPTEFTPIEVDVPAFKRSRVADHPPFGKSSADQCSESDRQPADILSDADDLLVQERYYMDSDARKSRLVDLFGPVAGPRRKNSKKVPVKKVGPKPKPKLRKVAVVKKVAKRKDGSRLASKISSKLAKRGSDERKTKSAGSKHSKR